MRISFPRLVKQAKRWYRNREIWRYDSFGDCASCGTATFFVDDRERRREMSAFTARWDQGERSKATLTERENWFCVNCNANFRTRVCAETVLRLLGLDRVGGLAKRLRAERSLCVYETAAHNVFRARPFRVLPRHVVSGYFGDVPPGTIRNGIRCENL